MQESTKDKLIYSLRVPSTQHSTANAPDSSWSNGYSQTGKFDKHILMWYTPENENVGVWIVEEQFLLTTCYGWCFKQMDFQAGAPLDGLKSHLWNYESTNWSPTSQP
jgi:hypothetical protein